MTIPFNTIKYIEDNGKPYKPTLVPAGVLRGAVGDCFDTCMIAVVAHPSLRYVEGIARNPETKEWILHSWVTDGKGAAIDLTWRAINKDTNEEIPVPTSYIGVEMDTKLLVEFVRATGYKSVLSNYWRNPEIANKILKM